MFATPAYAQTAGTAAQGGSTAGAIVSLLNYEINRALSEEALQRTLLARGFTPAPGSPEEFRELIQKDSERWGKLVRGLFRNPAMAVAAGASR